MNPGRAYLLRLLLAVFLGAGLGASAAVPARADPLVADLSKQRIEITTGFTGTEVLLFGAIDGPGDIVVVVRGPIGRAALRLKERVAGIWVNREQWTFDKVPYFYRLATSGRLQETVPDEIIADYQIGEDRIDFEPEVPISGAAFVKARKALLRKLNEEQLYDNQVGEIEFIGPGLFNVRLSFPANVHVGTYRVEVYLLRYGGIVSRQVFPLEIEKIGVGAEAFRFAHKYPAAYGALAIALAVFAGWLGSVLFRKL
jgi:uncharacterized protein (TIGR02186 family)